MSTVVPRPLAICYILENYHAGLISKFRYLSQDRALQGLPEWHGDVYAQRLTTGWCYYSLESANLVIHLKKYKHTAAATRRTSTALPLHPCTCKRIAPPMSPQRHVSTNMYADVLHFGPMTCQIAPRMQHAVRATNADIRNKIKRTAHRACTPPHTGRIAPAHDMGLT